MAEGKVFKTEVEVFKNNSDKANIWSALIFFIPFVTFNFREINSVFASLNSVQKK